MSSPIRTTGRKLVWLGGVVLALITAGAARTRWPGSATPPPPPPAEARPAGLSSRLVKNGAVVDFSLTPLAGHPAPEGSLLEGEHAEVRFRLTDATSGQPLRGVEPAAWLDLGGALADREGNSLQCRDKVGLYLQGIVGIRPMVDLNSYYLLVMNQDASILVIDPVVSMTGKTSLYATILLERSPADWVKSRDGKRLYVSMPAAGKVAVVDTESFKVTASVEVGEAPTRVALQPDGRYLWVGNNAAEGARGGVTVVDTGSLSVVARLPTGRGHHELAFSGDDRHAFVTNRGEGTVTVVDIARLQTVKHLATGPAPLSVAYSPLSQALYVADGKAGTLTVVDAAHLEVRARITARPGLGPLRFTPDGRWGLAVNTAERVVHVVDAADNRLAHTVPVGGEPFQVTFTRAYAYVRLLDSEEMALVDLASLGKDTAPLVKRIPIGTRAPRLAGSLSIADSVSPAASETAVFVVDPADSRTYFYMEGMNAPSGSFTSYGHRARAVTVADRSLREVEPGVFAATVRLPAAGRYDVAFLLDNPRVLHCFSAEARPNPALKERLGALDIEYLDPPARKVAGETLALRFRLLEPASRQPRTGLEDVQVYYYLAPGHLKSELAAREVEAGVYEAPLALPRPGAYYAHVAVPSLEVKFGDLPYRTVRVEEAAATGAGSGQGARAREGRRADLAR